MNRLKIQDIYTMEFYIVIKKDEIMLFSGKWRELEIMMLSEINQTRFEKTNIIFSLTCGSQRDKNKVMKIERNY
jgi:hypothetical protein